MIGSDLVRGAVLVPVAIAGHRRLAPALGARRRVVRAGGGDELLRSRVRRDDPDPRRPPNVQRANALVQATAQALSIGGWALAAAFLTFMPVSVFFAVNAVSFLVSAALIARIRQGREHDPHGERPRIREGIDALRPRPMLASGVVVLGIAVTITAGSWIGGVPTLIRDALHHGAGGFSIVMAGYAAGSILCGLLLARIAIRRKARAALLSWVMYLPGYGLLAVAHSLPVAIAGAFFAALGQSSAVVLLNSAAQEEVPDAVLGRVLGVISLTHRGAHATGLLLVSPLFAFVGARAVFGAAAIAVPLVGLGGLFVGAALTRRSA